MIEISPPAIINSVEVRVTVVEGTMVTEGKKVGVGVNVLEGEGARVGEGVLLGEDWMVVVNVGEINLGVLVPPKMEPSRGRK